MTATEQFIRVLAQLKSGDLGFLRTHAGSRLDESVDGFDLFAGLWWPLRQKNQRAPRREVAWLIAKLYAFRPIEHSPDDILAQQLRRCQPSEDRERKRYRQKVDKLLTSPLDKIETALQWALDVVDAQGLKVDWVKLTDDLSSWEREATRLKWAKAYLQTIERTSAC